MERPRKKSFVSGMTMVVAIVILMLTPDYSADAIVYFDMGANSMVGGGQVRPESDAPLVGVLANFSAGLNDIPAQPGFGVLYTITTGLRIEMDDGNSYLYDLDAYGLGLSLAYEKQSFYLHTCPSIAFFSASKSGIWLQTTYIADVDNSTGILIPATLGLRWKMLYFGGFANFISWSSPATFEKREREFLRWNTVATAHEECSVNALAVGLSLGVRFEL